MFFYSHWRALPITTRIKIALQFGIAKVGSTHVSDNQIIDDGYKIEDIERALNPKAIREYVGIESTDDMNVLWELLISKINGRQPAPKKEEAPVEVAVEVAVEVVPEVPVAQESEAESTAAVAPKKRAPRKAKAKT